MKIKTIEVFEFSELSKEAKERAHAKWIESNNYYFLSEYLNERLHELLKENNIVVTNDTSKAGTKPTQVQYSLSCSQGDGCMFAGTFEWMGYTVHIKQSGHYTHSNSKKLEVVDSEGVYAPDESEKAFDAMYHEICKQLENDGYAYIEHENSMENFEETCEANEYTFTKDGEMEDI